MAKKQKSSSPKKSHYKKVSALSSAKKSTTKKKPSKKESKKSSPKKSSAKKTTKTEKTTKTAKTKSPLKAKSSELAKTKTRKTDKRHKNKPVTGKKTEHTLRQHGLVKIGLKTDKAKDNTPRQLTISDRPPISQVAPRDQAGRFDNSLTEPAELNLRSTHPATFIAKQKTKLEELRDALLDQMADVAHDSLRSASENGGGAAFGQHMGDAGSEAYERDFALSLLSQEQDSLYEINEALRRIEMGTYGMCEKSGKPIPRERLEAIPWARYTVECQKNLEKNTIRRNRWESTPQFMDSLDTDEESEEEDADEESRAKNKE